MNKKMDVNFAFAILLLVAAIVAMYFWLDNANEGVKDIYSDRQEVSVPRDNGTEVIDEDAETDATDTTETTEVTETVVSSSEDTTVQ